MKQERKTNLSKFVIDELEFRRRRDEVYDLDKIQKNWLSFSPHTYAASINHEILREIIGLETFVNILSENSSISSTPVEKDGYEGEVVRAEDLLQVMSAGLKTIRKILLVNTEYMELKFKRDTRDLDDIEADY